MAKLVLNIPHKLMKRCRKDKSTWELFIFALCIKMVKGSSVIYPEVKEVRRMLNCSYYKAVRLIEGAKRCPYLFRYYSESNLLIARSFTHKRLERSEYSCGNRTFTAYHAVCFKFRFDSEDRISHFEISRMLRDVLIRQAITARQLKNGSNSVAKNQTEKLSSRSNRSTALYSVRLGKISGYHHSTVSRHIRKMEDAGEVKVFRPDYIPVYDVRAEKVVNDNPALAGRKKFLRQGYLMVRDANEYSITTKATPEFVHIIFNHSRRHRRTSPKPKCFADEWRQFANH